MEEMPLSALFEQARKIHLAASESGVDQDVVKKGCEMFQKCEDMIGKLALFSSNETKEDISTNNLKYLLVPYYLAELTEKIIQDDRILTVKASYPKLKEFFSFCEAMELVPDEELAASSRGGSGAPSDRRAQKIARFKRQKAAEAKLLEIKERKERRGRSTKASALSTPVESGEEDIPDDDSEEEREVCNEFEIQSVDQTFKEILRENMFLVTITSTIISQIIVIEFASIFISSVRLDLKKWVTTSLLGLLSQVATRFPYPTNQYYP
ncbi:hypothetical protein ARALYDRAFT_901602 [Arabidopsis lyrata subsp. lyrata]|uniref:PP2A regulatory subunit TAP46 n=1 Tax=Arabidopsis lyrata subsp. lyrata TaxID=81972 RepID=D7LGT7_ARALL|nr:hypothetical protein ARALYDRAFT_901602 [Arabidopsis lyrata subsp. lyrata]